MNPYKKRIARPQSFLEIGFTLALDKFICFKNLYLRKLIFEN